MNQNQTHHKSNGLYNGKIEVSPLSSKSLTNINCGLYISLVYFLLSKSHPATVHGTCQLRNKEETYKTMWSDIIMAGWAHWHDIGSLTRKARSLSNAWTSPRVQGKCSIKNHHGSHKHYPPWTLKPYLMTKIKHQIQALQTGMQSFQPHTKFSRISLLFSRPFTKTLPHSLCAEQVIWAAVRRISAIVSKSDSNTSSWCHSRSTYNMIRH